MQLTSKNNKYNKRPLWTRNIESIKGYFIFFSEYLLYISWIFFILYRVDWYFCKAQTSEVFNTLSFEISMARFDQLKNILEKIFAVV